ncbi:MAG: hypothetical protein V1855_04330 [bacterium]
MKKIFKNLLVAALVLGAFGVAKATSTTATGDFNKTYLNARSHGTNLALIHGAGINEIINRKDKDKFGGTFQAIGFYQSGEMDAEYWTPWGKNNFALYDATQTSNVFPNYINGMSSTSEALPLLLGDTTTKFSLDPEQDAYGVMLAYDQRLDSLLKGLYFRVQLPIVHVENDLGLAIEGKDKDDFSKFMKGTYESTLADKLTHAKIDGENSTTGIADIDVLLGYTFLNKEDYHASLNIGLTIPTGTDPDGVYLHEAVVGNGNHFGLGGGLTFDARLWGDKEHNIMLYVEAKYRYLFEATEKRTLGLKDIPFGHYLPLYKATDITSKTIENLAVKKSIPAANLTTLNVDVTPGSEFDGIVALAYNNGGFGANLGYNLYFREEEDVELKDTNPFVNGNEYHYIKSLTKNSTDNDTAVTQALTKTDLITAPAETPSQTTHKIFGGISWTFKDWETPVNVGLGVHYEFADGREAYDNWGINGRAAIGF